jgi:hypothetical protein
LFGCATEPATGELYFRDDAGHVHQLTVTEPRQGAWDPVWQGDRIVAVIDRRFQNGLELRDLSTPLAETGRRLGEGASPAVSPTGTLAYTRTGERNGRLVDLVVRRRGNRRRVIGHAPLVQQLQWISRRRLVAVSESRSGRIALVKITGRRRGRKGPASRPPRRRPRDLREAPHRVPVRPSRRAADRDHAARRQPPPCLPPRLVPAGLVAGRPSHPRRQPRTGRAHEPEYRRRQAPGSSPVPLLHLGGLDPPRRAPLAASAVVS